MIALVRDGKEPVTVSFSTITTIHTPTLSSLPNKGVQEMYLVREPSFSLRLYEAGLLGWVSRLPLPGLLAREVDSPSVFASARP